MRDDYDWYEETKQIVRGQKILDKPYQEMADWIFERYGHKCLSFFYEWADCITEYRARIWVTPESPEGYNYFLAYNNGDHPDNDQLRETFDRKFRQIVSDHNLDLNLKGLFFVFTDAFASEAVKESFRQVTEKEEEELEKLVSTPKLWKKEGSVFFFYTEDDVKEAEKSGLREVLSKRYAEFVRQYDEFGYFGDSSVSIEFDSKEYLDKHHGGCFYHYFGYPRDRDDD